MSWIRSILTSLCRPIVFVFGRAEKFHYLALTLAIVVGGGWTMYTFEALKMRENAENDLVSTQGDLEKAKLDLKELQDKIDGTDSSYIQIQTEQFNYAVFDKNSQQEVDKLGLIINVLVQNTGTNDVDMSWENSPLRVYKVESRNGDEERLYDSLIPRIYDGHDSSGKKTALKKLYLFVGAKKELSFFVELNEPGLYYIMFKADTNGSLDKKMTKMGKNGVWFSSKYVYVKKDEKPRYETYIRANAVFGK
ncbi:MULTISPECIES: hypothetical protein [unclassified Vibrio]|uniref:hypothetical protein n=1 Tax=unclassified Vibrio TaxID=2614977 RepID=UPI00352E4065